MSIAGLAVRRAPARLSDAYVLDLDGTIYLGDLLNDSEEP